MIDAPLDILDIARRIEALPADEQAIVISALEGCENGLKIYGTMSVDTDRRDWGSEAVEELRDCVVYLTAEVLRLRRQGR